MKPSTTRTITTHAEFQAILEDAPPTAIYHWINVSKRRVPKAVVQTWAQRHIAAGGRLLVQVHQHKETFIYTIEVP